MAEEVSRGSEVNWWSVNQLLVQESKLIFLGCFDGFKLLSLVIDSGLDLGLPLVVVLHTHFGHCVPDRVVLVLLDADELLAGQVELVELSLSELLLRVVSAVVLIVEHALDRQILQVVATKSRRSVSENNWRKIFKVPLFSRNRNRNSVLR